jgi:xylan 1,4-beta-xylosidase
MQRTSLPRDGRWHAERMPLFSNPVIPGFHPDPSVCRVGEDYYLVTSSFEWFPGVPIYHSRDLVHWRQLGHVLDRPSQLNLDGIGPSRGIFAATIRHHDGVFYVITTLVDGGGNFIVTATDPAGPWSEPHWLPETGDIDPSLLFDDEGRAWMCGTRTKTPGVYDGDNEIWVRELDLGSMKLSEEEHVIWDRVVRDGIWPEGPHIYQIDGRYYVMTSEGGTFYGHAVVLGRADRIEGPYEPCPANPIFTNRHLGPGSPITSTGHSDLVETQDGEWWMFFLATRPYGEPGERCGNLGRETFLTRVHWHDGWPVVDPAAFHAESPSLPVHRWPAEPVCDHFDSVRLSPVWNHLRTPREPYWRVGEGLRLKIRPQTLTERVNPSFVGRRQQHIDFAAHTLLDFTPQGAECAGLALIWNDDFQIRFVRTTRGLELVRRDSGEDTLMATAEIPSGPVRLGVEARGQSYQARYAAAPGEWRDLGVPLDGRILSTERAGGFTGTYIGLYASSNGHPSDNTATFAWFEYAPLP